MAFFMIAWWVIIGIIIILSVINYVKKDKKTKKLLDKMLSFLAIFQLLVLIIALLTKDPVFEAVGLPKEYEWIGGLFVSLFLMWQFYLSPLKERVIETEKDVREIKTDVKNIKEGIDRIEIKIK